MAARISCLLSLIPSRLKPVRRKKYLVSKKTFDLYGFEYQHREGEIAKITGETGQLKATKVEREGS